MFVERTGGEIDEGVGVDVEGIFAFPKLVEEVDGKESNPSGPTGSSTPSWRRGEGVGLNVGMNDAAAGFNGCSAKLRVDGGADDNETDTSCAFVSCRPLVW